jgi:hypothetical protein
MCNDEYSNNNNNPGKYCIREQQTAATLGIAHML